jgi:hypothetical protein
MSCKYLENGICKHKVIQSLKGYGEKMNCLICPFFRKPE